MSKEDDKNPLLNNFESAVAVTIMSACTGPVMEEKQARDDGFEPTGDIINAPVHDEAGVVIGYARVPQYI